MANDKQKINPLTGKFDLVTKDSLLKFKGVVATINDLPLSGNEQNDCYVVSSTDRIYTWNSTSSSGTIDKWVDTGSGTPPAVNVTTDTTNFTTILSSADTNVQLALDTLDKHTHTELDKGGLNEVSAAQTKDIVDNGVKSTASGDWKKVTSIEVNGVTGQIRVSYQT